MEAALPPGAAFFIGLPAPLPKRHGAPMQEQQSRSCGTPRPREDRRRGSVHRREGYARSYGPFCFLRLDPGRFRLRRERHRRGHGGLSPAGAGHPRPSAHRVDVHHQRGHGRLSGRHAFSPLPAFFPLAHAGGVRARVLRRALYPADLFRRRPAGGRGPAAALLCVLADDLPRRTGACVPPADAGCRASSWARWASFS